MVIVGLGNPGRKYAKTRHNVGFMFLDAVAKSNKVKFQLMKELNGMVAKIQIADQQHILLKPTTFMNNSGMSVKKVLDYYKIDIINNPNDLVVIYDDMDLECSKVRIRKFGSSGGHNGMKSIIENVKSDHFPRIRIGIGHPKSDEINYVLSSFNKSEAKLIQDIIDMAPNIIDDLAMHGIDFIMNKYNT